MRFMALTLFALTLLLASAAARPGQKGREPVMGWNTWCTQDTCGVDWCSEKEVLDVARSMKDSGMLAAGYDHINLDDCWGQRDSVTGHIVGDPARFPSGMPAVIEQIHKMGFKFGLYTDIGTAGCHKPFVGSFPVYQQDAQTFKNWDVDYVKFDGCDLPAGYTAEGLTCNMSQALLDTGRDFWLNFHCWHSESCAKCGTSFRIGPDHHDKWDSTSGIISLLQTRQEWWGSNPTHGWPDPDFIFTGGQGCNSTDPGAGHGDPGPSPAGVRCPGQTEDEYISEFSIWAIAGGQLVLASDPRNMSAFQKKVLLNQEIIQVYRDVSGFSDVAMVDASSGQVWARPVTGKGAAVVLHNPTSDAAVITVHFNQIPTLKWNSDTKASVRDLWAHEDIGEHTGQFSMKVPAHGAQFLKLNLA